MTDNLARRCLAICPLFKAELLLQLMLQAWGHSFVNMENFRPELLKSATELLTVASQESCTEVFIENLAPQEMNLVSALWYSEWCAAQDDPEERDPRQQWLNDVRRAFPRVFVQQTCLSHEPSTEKFVMRYWHENGSIRCWRPRCSSSGGDGDTTPCVHTARWATYSRRPNRSREVTSTRT